LPEPVVVMAAATPTESGPNQSATTPSSRVARFSPMSWSAAHRVTALLVALLVLAAAAIVLVLNRASESTLASRTVDGSSQRYATSPALRAELLQRAATVTKQAHTMTYATLTKDLGTATALMTPTMAKTYLEAFPADKRKVFVDAQMTYAGQVVAVGVTSMTETRATLVELLVMTAAVKGSKAQSSTPFRYHVTLTKVNGVWMLDQMDDF
jgi:hypothetical protein